MDFAGNTYEIGQAECVISHNIFFHMCFFPPPPPQLFIPKRGRGYCTDSINNFDVQSAMFLHVLSALHILEKPAYKVYNNLLFLWILFQSGLFLIFSAYSFIKQTLGCSSLQLWGYSDVSGHIFSKHLCRHLASSTYVQ